MTHRWTILPALVAATALALGGFAPVATAEDRGQKIGDAAEAMMRNIDIPYQLGAVDSHKITAIDAIRTQALLCMAKRPYVGRKGKEYYQSEMELTGAVNATRVTQRAYVYEYIAFARHAFAMIAQRARMCRGTFQNGSPDAPVKPQRIVLSSGRTLVRSEGKQGVWIAGNFAKSAAATWWAQDWYTVYLRAGHAVHVFTYEVDPANPGVPVVQRRALNRLAERLAARWLVELGRNWH